MPAPGHVTPAVGRHNTIPSTPPRPPTSALTSLGPCTPSRPLTSQPTRPYRACALTPRQAATRDMRRVTRDASPTVTQNRFAALAGAGEDNTEAEDVDEDAEMFDAVSDAPSPELAPIPCSLPALAEVQNAQARAQALAQPPTTSPAGPRKPNRSQQGSQPPAIPRSLKGLAANIRKAEEDLHARQQALYLYGEALDNVARGLPRSLRHLAPSIAQASASAIAQVLGFGSTASTLPTVEPNAPAPKAPRASGQPGASTAPSTYAGAAAKGASQPEPEPTAPTQVKRASKPRNPRKRNLVLLTLPEKARSEAPHPHAVKQLLSKTGPVSSLWSTKTGYAATVQGSAPDFAERAQEAAARIGAQARAATPTYGYVVARVPTTLRELTGGVTRVTEAMIADEAAIATKRKVLRAAWSRHSPEGGLERAAVIFFTERPVKEFRLFSTSAPSRPINRVATVTQCPRCWRFHAERSCRFGHRCRLCGDGRAEHPCPGAEKPRCANCLAPHEANWPRCPLRPVPQRDGSLTRPGVEQRAEIRRAGANLSKLPRPAVC